MLMALTGHAASYTTVTIDNIVYRLYGETMEAHVYHNKSSASLTVTDNRLELPEKVTNESKEYKVTEIEYFSCNNTALTLVTPKTVTTVASVKKGVKTLVLGIGVTSVSGLEESANLEVFEVADGNTYFSVDDRGVLYNKDKTKLRYAPYGKRSSFSSYVVASTVTYIGTNAFYGFNQLVKVTLPDGLKEIGNNAFYDCNALTTCSLPSTIEQIGAYAFYKCPLAGFSLPAQLRTIGSYAFASNGNNNYRIQGGHIQALHVPQYVESIGDNAFRYVTIDSVYAHCEPFNLTQTSPFGSPSNQTLVVPKGTRDIFSTYKYWNKIDNVIEGDFNPTFDTSKYPVGSSSLDSDGQTIMQAGVTYKLYNSGVARVYCNSNYVPATGVNSLTIPESIYYRALNYTLDGVEYFKASQVIDLLLPNTVTFVNNVKSGVQILKLSKSVTSVSGLEESANLEGFEIADGNTSFSVDESGVLYSKDKTKLLYAPYGKRSSFRSYVVASTVTYIGTNAFYGFNQLVKVTLPDGLKEIGNNAFYDCNALTTCSLPSTIEQIGAYAFYKCPLAGFSLPAQLRTIGSYAFASNGNNNYRIQGGHIQALHVPQYVESIGDNAFRYVTIDSVYSHIMSPLPISNNAFYNQSKVKLVVPTGTMEEYKLMGGWKLMTDIIESEDLLPKICITPKFTRKGNTLTLETSTTGASIYYTMDGKEPTVNSTLYDANSPIAPTSNCTIKAIAVKEGLDNSSVATYVVDWFKVEKPTFELNGTKLTIKTATEGASIYYILGADAVPSATTGTLYSSPIELTDNRVVKAIGVKAGYDDSDIAEYSHGSVACPTPVFEKYDGRYFTIKPIDGAEIRYTTDGSTPTKTSALYDGRTAVPGLCTIKAMAFSDVKNPSDVASFKVTYFYSGKQAELTEAGTLEKTFEWCGTQGMTELEVNGPLNAADLTFIKEKLSTLQFLNLENATLADHQLPTEAFAGMQLVSFTSSKDINSVGDRIFANCQQLAAVVWNSPETMPANSFGDKLNPNMLVYVTNKLFAPSGVQNVVADRRASSIVLSDLEEGNGNFYCPVSFTAEKISYTHVYSQKTEIGKCMGWETIALPFKVQKFMHESKGEVIPYKQFEAEGSSEVAKPFWLRALTATGFEDAATIEANIPYIISMPNSQEYAARYNIDGKITFSSENIVVPVTNTTPVNKGDAYFVPTFLRVAKSKDVWAINKNEIYEGKAEGSAFVQNLRDARPFEAYVTTKAVANMPMLLSIADMGGGNNGTTGISMMLSDKADLDGTWYSLDGRKLQGKPTIKGVYVNNGKKIVVR